jgi:peptidoglycan-associated lipoprotein
MSTQRRAVFFIALFSIVAGVTACGPKYPKCSKDDHCKDHNEVCVEGMCQQCRDDSNCAQGQQCKGGRCEAKPECSIDGDCKDNKVCRSGKCQTECTADTDCGKGLKCSKNRCVDELSCNDNSECKNGLPCVAGRCQVQEASSDRSIPCGYPHVQFPFNESTLSREAQAGLQQVVDCLKEKGGTLVIEGHCDERGTEEYNLALGDQRANAVKKYLERLGVSTKKIQTISKGKLEPIAPGHDEASWAKNRRAEFIER